jgi:hypothetical protein
VDVSAEIPREDEIEKAGRLTAVAAAAPCGERPAESPLALQRALLALAACLVRTAGLLVRRRIRQPIASRGREIFFADGSSAVVYRETVIDRPPPASPAVLVVGFRLRHVHRQWSHALFRLESELNTLLFAGFRGLVSKLWLRHDQHGLYRGFYQWDDPELAVAYVRALWWALALVSETASIQYAVLPGLFRDEVLADPAVIDASLRAAPGGWWRPQRPPSPRSAP